MMRKKIFLVFGLSAAAVLSTSGLLAETPEVASREMLALKEHCRTVLLDTGNITARQTLKDVLNSESDAIPRMQKLKYYRFLDTVEYVDFLKNRLVHLINSNESFLGSLLAEPSPDDEYIPELDNIRGRNKMLRDSDVFLFFPKDITGPVRYLDIVEETQSLLFLKDRLIMLMEEAQGINARLRSIRTDMARTMLNIQITERRLRWEDDMRQLKGQLQDKDMQYRLLGEHFQALEKDFTGLQGQLEDNNQKLATLTRDLANMSLDLYAREKLIADKDDQIKQLEDTLTETSGRFSLVQRIIEQKDEEINAMETEFSKLKAILGAQGVKDIILEGMGSGPSSQDGSEDRIVSLEARFADLSDKHQQLERKMENSEKTILRLEDRLNKSSRNIAILRKANIIKRHQVKTLDGIAAIYRYKLIDTHALLRDREEEIALLEKRISGLERELSEERGLMTSGLDVLPVDLLSPERVLRETYLQIDQKIKKKGP